MKIGGRWASGNVRKGGGMGPGMVGGGLGAVVLTIIALVLGVDPSIVTQGGGGGGAPAEQVEPGTLTGDEEFVSRVLGTSEAVWSAIFQEEFGQDYPEPQMTVFSQYVPTACGTGQSAMGPFYCPMDRIVYIDVTFYRELERLMGANGDIDFAKAYVVAHEVGHHVQTVLGISEQVEQQRRSSSQEAANALSVRQELQADCFAGIWAHRVASLPEVAIDPGDIEEGLAAASAIGDDKLQQQAQGYVVPESFTHGSSAQRVSWFRRGYQSGSMDQCDAFSGAV